MIGGRGSLAKLRCWRVACAASFAGVLLLALYSTTFGQSAWEVQLIRWQQAGSPGPLRFLAEALTWIGNSAQAMLVAGAAAALLLLARERLLAVLLIGAVLLRSLSPVLKDLVERPRPSPELVDVANQLSSASFPSGHALGATLLYGFLAYAAEFAIANMRIRRIVQAGCLSMLALMGYARIELGEHWPTDVLGGWLIGLLLVIALAWVHQHATLRAPQAKQLSR